MQMVPWLEGPDDVVSVHRHVSACGALQNQCKAFGNCSVLY